MKQQKDGTSKNKNAVILTFNQSSTLDQLLMNILNLKKFIKV